MISIRVLEIGPLISEETKCYTVMVDNNQTIAGPISYANFLLYKKLK
jgi:hypothetical protein